MIRTSGFCTALSVPVIGGWYKLCKLFFVSEFVHGKLPVDVRLSECQQLQLSRHMGNVVLEMMQHHCEFQMHVLESKQSRMEAHCKRVPARRIQIPSV